MAETMVADGRDPFVIEYNPAGISLIEQTTVAFSHNSYFQDARGEYACVAFPRGVWGFGARVGYMGSGDIPRREGPSEEPLGFYDAASGLFQGAIARTVDDRLSIGLSAAYVLEHIDTETAGGMVIGLGGRFQADEAFTVGISFVNPGGPARFIEREFAMPNQARFGAEWHRAHLSVRGEAVTVTDDKSRWHFGSEYALDPRLTLRGGVRFGYDSQRFNAGLGIGTPDGRFVVDYAFAPYSEELGSTHRFGLTVHP